MERVASMSSRLAVRMGIAVSVFAVPAVSVIGERTEFLFYGTQKYSRREALKCEWTFS